MQSQLSWWQTGIIYQVYPRSFQDSNGDGVGDLAGLTSRLDYLKALNCDAVWLSPVYPSPMADFGYDVSDYTGVDPIFGTLEDFDRLLAEIHARGMKLLMDFVPNHTSEEHPWFLESRRSRTNPKRDWYMWADAKPDGSPPNNWLSEFGGSSWEWDEPTGQYYYHRYTRQQPDLNWRNPEVRDAMYSAMRFWLDKGVDGFRVDAAKNMLKDPLLRDDPPNPNYVPGTDPARAVLGVYSTNLPENHQVIRDMRALVDEYPERMMVGEIYLPFPELVKYHGENLDEFNLVYNFSLIRLPWEVGAIRQAIEEYEALLPEGAWPNWVLGNHDRHRVASRIGSDQARVAQMLLLTLRGTPTCYYGDEIGMVDVEIPPERVVDPWEFQVPGIGVGRDPERTPMQWNAESYGGFSSVEPWLPISPDYTRVNVATEQLEPSSMLSLFTALTALRRSTPALSAGTYRSVAVENQAAPSVLAYIREHEDKRILVVLNLSHNSFTLNMGAGQGHLLLATGLDRTGLVALDALELRGSEGLIISLP